MSNGKPNPPSNTKRPEPQVRYEGGPFPWGRFAIVIALGFSLSGALSLFVHCNYDQPGERK